MVGVASFLVRCVSRSGESCRRSICITSDRARPPGLVDGSGAGTNTPLKPRPTCVRAVSTPSSSTSSPRLSTKSNTRCRSPCSPACALRARVGWSGSAGRFELEVAAVTDPKKGQQKRPATNQGRNQPAPHLGEVPEELMSCILGWRVLRRAAGAIAAAHRYAEGDGRERRRSSGRAREVGRRAGPQRHWVHSDRNDWQAIVRKRPPERVEQGSLHWIDSR
jgi:hypothetical protein